MNYEHLKEWIGRQDEPLALAALAPLAGLAATLDHDASPWRSGEVPPLGHWLYFLPQALQREISEDGPRTAAASCHQCPCRGACGLGATCNSILPSASV